MINVEGLTVKKNRRERTLLIVGAGSLGQDVAEIAMMSGRYAKIAFLDDQPTPEKERQYTVVGTVGELEKFVGMYGYAISAATMETNDSRRNRVLFIT